METQECFFLPENADTFDFKAYSYVVDAIDTVSGKLALAEHCKKYGTRLISAMGAGNKWNPANFEVADISQTKICPLARVMRRELKKRGIERLKVVYSREKAIKPYAEAGEDMERPVPGSVSFVPSVAGLILAGEVIKDLAQE